MEDKLPDNSVKLESQRQETGAPQGRKRSNALPCAEELFRLMVESAKDYSIFAADTEGRIVSWNTGAARVFGYTEAEAIGQNVSIFFTPEDVAGGVPEQELIQAAAEGKAEDERWHVCKDGSCVWMRSMVTPIRDEAGSLLSFVKIARDLSESKIATEAQRDLEEHHRVIAEAASDAIVTIDEAGIILFANPAAEKIFGYRVEEMHGASVTMLMPEKLRQSYLDGNKRYLETGQRLKPWNGVELPGLHKSGKVIALEFSFGEIVKNGKHFFTGIIRDISQRKDAERRLAAQHAITRILAESEKLGEAAPRILQVICETLRWDVGALWRIDRNDDVLRCVNLWQASASNVVVKFVSLCCDSKLERGVGLPGRVWQAGASLWIPDVLDEANFPGRNITGLAGLHGAFCFPISLGDEVLGVMEFFSREIREPDQELLDMMSTIGSQTGQFIERKQVEAALRKAHDELEGRVKERTAELAQANEKLQVENVERKRAEEELSASQKQLADAQEIVHIGSWEWDFTTNKVYLSDEYYRIFGFQPQEFEASFDAFLACVHPDDRDFIRQDNERALRDHQPFGSEYRIIFPGGETRTIYSRGEVIKDESGRAIKMRGTVEDITEHNQTKKALEQSERDYRTVFEQAHDAIIVFAPEQEIILEVNQRACEIYGFNRSEFIGMSLETLSKNPAHGKEKVKETLEVGDHLNFETVQYRKDGSEMFLEINASKIIYQGQQAIITINRDVTERKQAEEALRASEEKFRSLAQTALDAIISANSRNQIISWNKGAEIMFGYSEEEALGQPLTMLMPEAYRAAHSRGMERHIRTGESYVVGTTVELQGLRKDGTKFPLELSLATWKVGSENFYSGILRDITERVQAKEARLQLQQRLLTAQEEERRRISRELHDQMGQYLPALLLGLKVLENAGRNQPPPADLLPRLQDLAASIARDVHDMSRDLRPTALDDFGLQVALAHYAEEWSERHDITADFYSSGLAGERLAPLVEITLYRVAQEALTNILKHAHAHHVSIILEYAPDGISLLVEDDGQGFNVEAVMETPVMHRRLGLLGMQERVTLAGGTLKVESDTGIGTIIIARIPISQEKEAATHE